MARHAVVFGSNGPASAGALQYAKRDAQRIADALRHPRCGFNVIEPYDSIDPQEIERRIGEIAELCADEDTFAVFFSGHGFVERGGLLLMLDRTNLKQPLTTALHADSIVRSMRYCSARHKMLILDCCHAGMVFSDSRFKSEAGAKMEAIVGGIDRESESFVAIMASDRLERAREFDEFGGSFLTNSICEAIGNSFAEADQDRDGAIDLGDLKLWLADRARKHNQIDASSRVPIPFVFGRERGRLYVTLEPTDWRKCEINGPDGHSFVVLPLRVDSTSTWLIGATPVTNAQYRRFVNATGHREPIGEHFVGRGRSGAWKGPFRPWEEPQFCAPDNPVVCVNFDDAMAFSSWLQGLDETLNVELVPTEIWDFAAFGLPYPSFDRRNWLTGKIHDKNSATAPLSGAADRANRFGVVDLFGNVWEWTFQGERADARIAILGHFDDWERRNQQLRGGSFLDDLAHVDPVMTAAAMKDGTATKHSDLGFRLAAQIDLEDLPSEVIPRVSSAPRIARGGSWKIIARSA